MQSRYTGDIGDFGKFLLLKHLFPHQPIATIWYLYPGESHNTDGRYTVEEGNTTIYRNCYAIDPHMSNIFNTIHSSFERHIDLFETFDVLNNGCYFSEEVLGKREDYRIQWLERAVAFVKNQQCSVVCLDPDNGIEPSSMKKLSILKQGKYAKYAEIEQFFALERVDHVVIYQHFNRLKKHEEQMKFAKEKFEMLYKGRAKVNIIRHNPVQARFYIILSKIPLYDEAQQSILDLRYGERAFFSYYE